MKNQAVLLLVWCARNVCEYMECGKASQKKEHGLTEKGNVVENSAGIAMFTTEALVKETVTEKRAAKM